MQRMRWWHAVLEVAVAAMGGAVFPRVAYWLRWPNRLGVRGRLAYAAFNAALIYVMRFVVAPRAKRAFADAEQLKQRLRDELGREPTHDEFIVALQDAHWDSPIAPARGPGEGADQR